MMPPLRPLQPLLQTSTLQWGSRSRPSHAFQIKRYLSDGDKRKEDGFPYIKPYWPPESPKRKELLRRLRFPREYPPTLSKIRETMKHIPQLFIAILDVGAHYGSWKRRPRPAGINVKSRIGNFFYDFVTQPRCYSMLNKAIQPWGFLAIGTGESMEPTYRGHQIVYCSYAYRDSGDISKGDVVTVLGLKFDDKRILLTKRVAALEGDRIWVVKKGQKEIIKMEPKECYILGDNPPKSGDSREFGALPIASIWAKDIWQYGPDGFRWIDHTWHPWLENKVITHLEPGQNRPPDQTHSDRSPSTKERKKPISVLRPKVKPPPPLPPSPPKKQPNDPRRKPQTGRSVPRVFRSTSTI